MPTFVAHICRNKQCDAIWIDKDLTNVKTFPPSWKYCRECAEKLGIDYDAQTPTSNLSEKELAHLEKKKEQAQKMREKTKQNINSEIVKQG